MIPQRLIITILFLSVLSFAACEKKESPLPLPPPSIATPAEMTMGDGYKNQVFFDFESNKIVKTSDIGCWDLAFETGPYGSRVLLNGSDVRDVAVYNTHVTDWNAVTAMPQGFSDALWKFDSPTGLPDSTAIGNWYDFTSKKSKNEVYLIRTGLASGPVTKWKVQFGAVDEQGYSIKYADINGGPAKTVSIRKDTAYSYTYFSFATQQTVAAPDPEKRDYDLVLTRYRHIYYELGNFPYSVTGFLLNPFNTLAAVDSTSGFENVGATTAKRYTNNRNVIGFDWKTYDFNTEKYVVNSQKTYIIRNRSGHLYKMRFTGFQKGNGMTNFEFQLIQ